MICLSILDRAVTPLLTSGLIRIAEEHHKMIEQRQEQEEEDLVIIWYLLEKKINEYILAELSFILSSCQVAIKGVQDNDDFCL